MGTSESQFSQDISLRSRGEPQDGHALVVSTGLCEEKRRNEVPWVYLGIEGHRIEWLRLYIREEGVVRRRRAAVTRKSRFIRKDEVANVEFSRFSFADLRFATI